MGVLAQTMRAGGNLIRFGKADHFFKWLSALIAFIFINRHRAVLSKENILSPSIAYPP